MKLLACLILLDLSLSVFVDRHLQRDLYSQIIAALSADVSAEKEFSAPFQKLKTHFFNSYFEGNTPLSAPPPRLLDELISLANSKTFEAKHNTYSYGLSSSSNSDRSIVSGAKGNSGGNFSNLSAACIAEANDSSASGLVASFAVLYPNNRFTVEVKTSSYDLFSTETGGAYIAAFAESSKQEYRAGKTSVGMTRIHLLTVGPAFVRYTNYVMIAGASIETGHVKCAVSTLVTSFCADSSLKTERTQAGFNSNNLTNQLKATSSHQSYLAVKAEDIARLVEATGMGVADSGVAYSKGDYIEIAFNK